MQLPFRTARILRLKRTIKWPAVRPVPAPAGDSLLVSRFLPTRELTNNRITLHRSTSAKTPRPSLRSVRGTARHRDSEATPHIAERYQ
jgi:hypothetical protein